MKKTKSILSIILIIFLIPILFLNCVILLNAIFNPGRAPGFLGWKPIVVIADTMENTMYPGDLAIVKEENIENIKENDIIAFRTENILLIHRVIKIENENGVKRFITKGDNRPEQDEGYVDNSKIEGIYQYKYDKIGNFILFVQTPMGMVLCLFLPLLLLILVYIMQNSKENKILKEKLKDQQDLQKEIDDLKKQNEETK